LAAVPEEVYVQWRAGSATVDAVGVADADAVGDFEAVAFGDDDAFGDPPPTNAIVRPATSPSTRTTANAIPLRWRSLFRRCRRACR